MKADTKSLKTSFEKCSFPQNIQKEIPDVLPRFFDLLLPAAFSFGGIALAVSLYRSIHYGWYTTLTLHIVMYLLSLLVLLFRRRIPVHTLFYVFFGLMSVGSFYSLYTMGLAGEGMMMLSLLCTFTGLFFGFRAGIVILVVGITAAFLIGMCICTGMIPIDPEVFRALGEPATWLIQLALCLMLVLPLIRIMNHMYKKMAGHLHDSREMNTCLQKEISARFAAENKLEESELKYRSVVENSFVAFYIVQEGIFRFVNSRFCALTGYIQDELIDKLGPVEITHSDDRQKIAENIRRRLDGEEVKNEYESKVVRKDGSIVMVKVMGNLFSFNGNPAIFGALIDITNEKLLESKLIQSQKMEAVATLAGGIAHDFNNILTALTGFGAILHRKLQDQDPLRRYTTQILSAAEKASALTQSLLTFSRLQPVASKPVHLNAVIRDTEELLKRIITEDIPLQIELSREKIIVLADIIHINQILFNLASNAKDAMPTGGEMKISTDVVELDDDFIRRHGFGKKGRYGLLSVSDTGTGMDETTMQKIFDPFFTTKEVGKGTGLGLSSVYGIVKQHRGYVAIESEMNKGSNFRIYLPICRNPAGMVLNPAADATLGKGKETILIAEDNDAARFFLKELLSDCGYQVIEAVDGKDALEKFRSCENVSLVILDSVMPKLNANALNHIIQETRPGTRTLFMSGYTKDIVLSKGILDQSVDFIAKPVHPDLFLSKVREILDRKNG